MGYNSTLLILNDQLHCIRDDTQFGEKVARAVITHGVEPFPEYIHGARVLSVDHADVFRGLVVGTNTAWDIGIAGRWGPYFQKLSEPERQLGFLKRMAQNLGYRLEKISKGEST